MVCVKFEYYDEYCRNGRWNEQVCIVESVADCIKIYGLDSCQYRIVEVKQID